MTCLVASDLRRVVSRLPRDLAAMVTGNVILGGGFIRDVISGEKPSDIDLFVSSKEEAESLRAAICGSSECDVVTTDNAITITRGRGLSIQIITRWLFDSPQALLGSFDFTVCCAAVFSNGGHWDSLVDPCFYSDLAARRLSYRSPKREEEPGGSLIRSYKFASRGFYVSPESIAKLVARVIGDESVSESVRVKLREVDPVRGFE